MMILRLLTLSLILLALQADAQDTSPSRPPEKDSSATPQITDTVSVSPIPEVPAIRVFQAKDRFPSVYGPYVGGYMKADRRFDVFAPERKVPVQLRSVENRDWVFYFFCGLLFLFALIRLSFPKYVNDLFRVFFNTSMRQLQLREQLSQTPLPSLILNLIFCLSGGAFIFFLLRHYKIHTGYGAIAELFIWAGIIAAVYLAKYIFILLLGWMFDRRSHASNYLFTIFLVNKVAGLALIPFSVLLAYIVPGRADWVIGLTITVLCILLLVRLARGFQSIRTLRINLFQFLLFVAAFEVAPVLIICRLLLRFIV